jgi:transcriptional regulator with XRE-family HTH domain
VFRIRLRELRQARGCGLHELARRVPCSPTHICDMEAGRKRPSPEMVARLDAVLDAGGTLAAQVVNEPTEPEQGERIAHALRNPARLDGAAIAAFAEVLAAQRRLDDTVPAQLLSQAADEADELDCGVLAAQAANFRGYLARQRQAARHRPLVPHRRAHPGGDDVAADRDMVQAAHGLALLGNELKVLLNRRCSHRAPASLLLDVVAVFPTRAEFTAVMPPMSLFNRAQRIRASGLSLTVLCQHYGDQSLTKLIREGASRLPDEMRDGVEIAIYDETIRFNVTLVDDCKCIVQPYLPALRSVDSPTIVIDRTVAGTGLYQTFKRVFDLLWQDRKPR